VHPAAAGTVGGTVPATLVLTLGAPASSGAFVPGVAHDYPATTTATVTSTAGNAALTVTGANLANGAFTLPQALQADADGGAYGPVSSTPATLLTYAGPVSDDDDALGFRQPIAGTDALRTGTYTTTLTFTLSTTAP
jgi:hypothetical protein